MPTKRAKTSKKEPKGPGSKSPRGCEAIAARRRAGVLAKRATMAEAAKILAVAVVMIVGACVIGCSLAQPIAPNAAASNTATNTANTNQSVDVKAPNIAAPAKVELPPGSSGTTTAPTDRQPTR